MSFRLSHPCMAVLLLPLLLAGAGSAAQPATPPLPPATGNGPPATPPLPQATGNRQQATGNGQQAAGNGQQAAGNGQQAAGNGQQAAGNGQQAAGNGQQATGNGQQATGNGQQAAVSLAELETLAINLAGTGDERESERIAAQAEALFAELEEARLAKSSAYLRNRSAYDGLSRYAIALERKRQAAAEAGGFARQATPAAMALAVRFPEHPERRAFALAAAEKLLALGRADEAVPWFLAALDTGLDRSFGTKAKLAENQIELDAVAKPLPEEHLRSVLAGLLGEKDQKDGEEKGQRILHEALCLTKTIDTAKAIAALESLLGQPPFSTPPLDDIVLLEFARTHLRVGHAQEAQQALARIESERVGIFRRHTAWGRAVAAHRDFLEGVAASLLLDRPAAAGHFAAAADLGGEPIADAARFEQARCLELDGHWKPARKLYRKLAADSPAASTRRLATIALARLDALGTAPLAKSPLLVQIPDDRETHGDWFLGYGRNHHVLCAHNYRQDIEGGIGPELDLAFSTADPKEPSRLWVSAEATADPAALWNPRRRARVPANRDDRGEQYPIGQGPDLLVDATIPDGRHILSLYFVNDHRYHESNRRYTLEIRSGDRLLALADIRDFGTGLYKRFLVQGSLPLRLRLRRDASMNVLLQGVFLDTLPALAVQSSDWTDTTDRTDTTDGERSSPPSAIPLPELLSLSQPLLPPPLDVGSSTLKVGRSPLPPLNVERSTLSVGRSPSSPPLNVGSSTLNVERSPSSSPLNVGSSTLNVERSPRSSRALLASLISSLPPEHLLPAARALAAHLAAGDPFFGMHAAQWPDATPHPVDLLNARWFAVFPDADPALLRAILLRQEPQATPFAQVRALAALERLAPASLTPSILAAAGRQFQQQGDPRQATLLLRRALAAHPDPRTELRACLSLLDLAPQADLPAAEIRALFPRATALARIPGDAHLLPLLHLHAAEALARCGEPAEALALLDHAPPKLAAPLRQACQHRLAERQKEPQK